MSAPAGRRWQPRATIALAGSDLEIADEVHHSPNVRITLTSHRFGDAVAVELDAAAVRQLTDALNQHAYLLSLLRD